MAQGIFDSKQEAFDFMESFAVGDPVNLYQTGSGGMYHYGTVHRAVVFNDAEIFGGKYAKMEIKMKRGNNIVILTDKMMVEGSWVLNYIGENDVIANDEEVISA